MCVAMVIIHTKTLEKKAVDDVTSKESTLDLVRPKQAKALRYRYERLTRRDSWRLPFPQGSRLPVTDSQERADLITKRFHSEFAFLGEKHRPHSGHRKWCQNCLHCLYCVGKKACYCNSLPLVISPAVIGIAVVFISWLEFLKSWSCGAFLWATPSLAHYSLRLQAHPGKNKMGFPVSWKMRKPIQTCKQGSYRIRDEWKAFI